MKSECSLHASPAARYSAFSKLYLRGLFNFTFSGPPPAYYDMLSVTNTESDFLLVISQIAFRRPDLTFPVEWMFNGNGEVMLNVLRCQLTY